MKSKPLPVKSTLSPLGGDGKPRKRRREEGEGLSQSPDKASGAGGGRGWEAEAGWPTRPQETGSPWLFSGTQLLAPSCITSAPQGTLECHVMCDGGVREPRVPLMTACKPWLMVWVGGTPGCKPLHPPGCQFPKLLSLRTALGQDPCDWPAISRLLSLPSLEPARGSLGLCCCSASVRPVGVRGRKEPPVSPVLIPAAASSLQMAVKRQKGMEQVGCV